MSGQVPITPDTRVAQLLEAYPDLQKVLIAAAPAFSKLKNPVLRRTIARVTTLKRAAEVAGISARDLVIRLRRAAGLGPIEVDIGEESESDPQATASWVDPGRVQWTVDADSLLADDQQPISEVKRKASALSGDELGLIQSSFRPAPLIEMLEAEGFRTTVVASGDSFATYVGLSPD